MTELAIWLLCRTAESSDEDTRAKQLRRTKILKIIVYGSLSIAFGVFLIHVLKNI